MSLAERVQSPGFTPSQREAVPLLDLLATCDKELVTAVERALLRIAPAVTPSLRERFAAAKPPARARYLRVLARAAEDDGTITELLVASLADADMATRRAAARALGRKHGAAVEAALAGALARAEDASERRALVEALGKVGSPAALDALKAAPAGDADLERRRTRALLMVERSAKRVEATRILADVAASPTPGASITVALHCRSGLEPMLEGELAGLAPRKEGPGLVYARLDGPLRALFRARTWLSFGLVLPPETRRSGESLVEPTVRALTAPEARALLTRLTEGPLRFRLSWPSGHRRSLTWECAARVAEAWPELVNDAKEAPWTAVVEERGPWVHVELVPRGLEDPRFRYRVADVPAASHPTLAAALARVAGVRADDVVWDPFVGSALELVERGLAGPYARLVGSDTDGAALEMAFANLESAGVPAELHRADARVYAPEGVTLIVTNPPMGRRVVHHAALGALLDAVVDHGARVLVPGGRFVWLSPAAERTRRRAEAAGLVCSFERPVDMGGFTAVLQRFDKPEQGEVTSPAPASSPPRPPEGKPAGRRPFRR